MIRPVAKTLLHTIAATIAGAAVFLAIVLWRLSTGPISLSFLAPYVEQALNYEDASYRLNFADLRLTWAGWERTLDVRASDVQSFSTDGALLATFPEMAVEFSIGAMLRGIIAPTKLELFKPDVHLNHDVNSVLDLGTNEPSRRNSRLIFADEIGRVLGVQRTDSRLSYLQSVSILDGSLVIYGPDSKPRWAAKRANVVIERSSNGLHAELELEMDLDGSFVDLEIEAQLNSENGLINADINFSPVEPKRLSRITSIPSPLEGINLALNGRATIVADLNLDVQEATFKFNGGPGNLSIQNIFPGNPTLKVTSLRVEGILEPSIQKLTLEEVYVNSENTTIHANGSIQGGWLQPAIEADIALENIPLSRIDEFWPQTLAENARQWITSRILRGTVQRLDAHLNLKPGDWENGITDRETIYGQFIVVEGTVNYFPGLPVAEKLVATGWYDGMDLHLDISDGLLENQNIRHITVNLSDINGRDEHGMIQIKTAGPVADLFRALDTPTLKHSQIFPIDSTLLKGTIETDLEVKFPLLKDLEVEDLQVSGTANLSNVAIREFTLSPLLPKTDIKDLQGEIIINLDGFYLSGVAIADSMPFKFSWQENFNPMQAKFTNRIDLHARLGEAERKLWKINDDRLRGFTEADVTFITDATGVTDGKIIIDAVDAYLDLPSLGWNKVPGYPAKAEIGLRLNNGIPFEDLTFQFNSGNFGAHGHVELNNQHSVETLVFKLLEVGETRLTGRIDLRDDEKHEFDIKAERLDIRPFRNAYQVGNVKPMSLSGTANEILVGDGIVLTEVKGHMTHLADEDVVLEIIASDLDLRAYFANKGDKDTTAEDREPNLLPASLSGTIKRVLIDDQIYLSDVRGEARYDGDKISAAHLEASVGESGNIKIRISEATNARNILITAKNAGAILRSLDITDDVVGGILNLQGTFQDDEEDRPLSGDLIINEFHVINAPPLAKLLTVATLTGALELLGGQGLPFDKLHAPFVYKNKKISLNKARATGLSLGLTIDGIIELNDYEVDLNGTIIPAYTINSIVGHVPVIGDILTGGDGQGVFALAYRARGPLSDTEITVNPLTALAPGIFRDLFKIFDRPPINLEESD